MTTQAQVFDWIPDFLPPYQADQLLEASQALDWQQNSMTMFGKETQLPRLEIMLGDPGCQYRYGSVVLEAAPWIDPLKTLRAQVEAATGYRYPVVIGNLYRSGADHIGWHRDDSPEMGPDPAIASVSLGATRQFQLRDEATRQLQSFDLTHGSLLIMHPGCQTTHKHRLVKTKTPVGTRINWTFRPHQLRQIELPLSGFDYGSLDPVTREQVQQHTAAIKGLMKRAAQDIIEIGQALIAVKEQLPHGQFGSWLRTEFEWSVRTAQNFMSVARQFGEMRNGCVFAPKALYLLSASGVPEVARQESLQLAAAGEMITPTVAQTLIESHTDPPAADSPPPDLLSADTTEEPEPIPEDPRPPAPSRKPRIHNDFYETSEGLTQALLQFHPELQTSQILEPCAGEGAIARLFPHCLTNDLDPHRSCDHGLDATDPTAWAEFEPVDWVVTNPPFSLASRILPLALDHARVGVAFLLRLTYLEPCSDRADWLREHADQMRFCLPCNPRPQFRQDTDSTDSTTVAWFIWMKDWSWSERGISPPFHFITGWR